MKILAIGSHPDDIEIFMFGFLSTCLQRGDQICLVIATDGSMGGVHPGLKLAKKRKLEAQNGLKYLGEPIFLNFKDGSLHDEKMASKVIREIVNDNQPDLIVTHAPEDYHPDHRALSYFVTDAAGFICPVLFCDTLMGVGFTPDYYVDISLHFTAKKNAIMAHSSQGPSRFARASQIMNRFRAAQCNAPDDHYAEAYRIDNRFPFADIRDRLPPSPPYRPFYVSGSDALI